MEMDWITQHASVGWEDGGLAAGKRSRCLKGRW